MPKIPWSEREIETDPDTGFKRVRVSEAKDVERVGGVLFAELPVYRDVDFGEAVPGQGEDVYERFPRRRPGWFDRVVDLSVKFSWAYAGDESLLTRDDIRQLARHYLATASEETCKGSPEEVARRVKDRIKDELSRQRRDAGRLSPAEVARAGGDRRAHDVLRLALREGGASVLTPVESERMWLLIDGHEPAEIARLQDVARQSVHESLAAAVRRLAEHGFIHPNE